MVKAVPFVLAALLGLSACMPPGGGTTGSASVMVGGKPMPPTRTILDNAAASADHTLLVHAVEAAGLADTLESPGPYTIFAPTNAAFGRLPAGTLDRLVRPENKEGLVRLLGYHIVPGRLDAAALRRAIAAGGGRAALRTVGGGTLTAMLNGPDTIVLRDARGGVAAISIYDVAQSNGMLHVIDRVLSPN